jgi:Leucine-rich repeat (LRR) protein
VIQSKASLSSSASGAAVVKFATDLKDSTFSELRTHLERINAGELDLSGATGITSLEPLKGLTNLTQLNLSCATGITSLEQLKGLTNLTRLDLTRDTGITSLEPLKGLTNLTGLDLTYATGIKSLEPLKGAHDFLARIIGQLIGRLKPTLVARARPLVAPNRWSIQAVRRGSQREPRK